MPLALFKLTISYTENEDMDTLSYVSRLKALEDHFSRHHIVFAATEDKITHDFIRDLMSANYGRIDFVRDNSLMITIDRISNNLVHGVPYMCTTGGNSTSTFIYRCLNDIE